MSTFTVFHFGIHSVGKQKQLLLVQPTFPKQTLAHSDKTLFFALVTNAEAFSSTKYFIH